MPLKRGSTNDHLSVNFALLHTVKDNIVKVLQDTSVIEVGNQSFIVGLLAAPDPSHFDNGKRVAINLRHVVSFTELTSLSEIYQNRREMAKIKLLRRTDKRRG